MVGSVRVRSVGPVAVAVTVSEGACRYCDSTLAACVGWGQKAQGPLLVFPPGPDVLPGRTARPTGVCQHRSTSVCSVSGAVGGAGG